MSVTDLVARAVRPLSPGAVGGDGFSLESVEATPTVRLAFRGPHGARFVLRFRRRQPGARFFATTGRLDLILDTDSQPPRVVEDFVRRLAVQIGRNTAAMSEEEIDSLTVSTDSAGHETRVHPALRRRAGIDAAGLLDINVGDGCNLVCTFCTDVDSRGRHLFRPASFWIEELNRAREDGKTGLLISGNEPTLRPDLPEIVSAARQAGFIEIELSTAGVRLAERAYLAELLDAGVNVLAVSIHGSNAAVDGAQTGRPDFFEARRRGFEHFRDLVGDRAAQEARGVYLKTISILTRGNLLDLPALVAFLELQEVSYILLHYPWIKGAAASDFDAVVPDYAAVMQALRPLEARLRQPSASVAVANLPACVASGLASGRTTSKKIVRPSSAADAQARPFLRVVSPMDPTLTHGECCTRCESRVECRGVPARYLERFGELGLRSLGARE